MSRVYSLSQPDTLYAFAQDGATLSIDVPAAVPDPDLTILVAEYEGRLEVDRPFVRQGKSDTIVLDDGSKRVDDFHGGVTYKSVQKGVRNSWEVEVARPGTYTIDISYRLFGKKRIDGFLTTDNVPIAVTAGGRQFHAGLPFAPGRDTVRLGCLDVTTPGRTSFAVTMDLEKLKTTESDFSPAHAPLLLNVERITLTRDSK